MKIMPNDKKRNVLILIIILHINQKDLLVDIPIVILIKIPASKPVKLQVITKVKNQVNIKVIMKV